MNAPKRYPYRYWNEEVGEAAAIEIVACEKHATMVMDELP